MKLASYVDVRHIVCGLDVTTLAEAIQGLLQRAEHFKPQLPIDAIVERVLQREHQAPTTVGRGLALPHARISELGDFYLMLGIPKAPLEDLGPDRTPVDLVFLILTPDDKNTVMLQTMAAISRLAMDAGHLDALKRADTPERALAAIDESGVLVRKGLYARDLMQPCPVVAHPEMPLAALLDALFAHRVGAVPVLLPLRGIVGAVSSEEIIDAGFPDYMSRLPNLGFVSDSEPFEHFFKREATMKVEEAMNRQPVVVGADDSMIQVVFKLKKHRQRFAFVLEEGKLAGMIDRDDILRRVLRA